MLEAEREWIGALEVGELVDAHGIFAIKLERLTESTSHALRAFGELRMEVRRGQIARCGVRKVVE